MDAVVQVTKAYYGVLVAEEMVAVAEEALEIAREGYRLAEARYDAGTISRFELLQSRVAWENRRPEAISARSALETARRSLAVAMGLPDTVEVEVDGELTMPVPGSLPSSLSEARESMRRHSPDLETARGLREVGDAGVDLARADLLPSLVFQTDYSYSASRDDWRFETDDYSRSWSSSVALTVPIFAGLGDIAGYESARAERVSSYSQARSLEQASGLSLVRAWNKLDETRERVESATATVAEAEEAAEIAGVSYEAGTITRLAMDQAFLALTSARTNLASALYDLRSAEIDLMRAVGRMALATERG
jgi:outer membrane protein TolC